MQALNYVSFFHFRHVKCMWLELIAVQTVEIRAVLF